MYRRRRESRRLRRSRRQEQLKAIVRIVPLLGNHLEIPADSAARRGVVGVDNSEVVANPNLNDGAVRSERHGNLDVLIDTIQLRPAKRYAFSIDLG